MRRGYHYSEELPVAFAVSEGATYRSKEFYSHVVFFRQRQMGWWFWRRMVWEKAVAYRTVEGAYSAMFRYMTWALSEWYRADLAEWAIEYGQSRVWIPLEASA